MKSPRPDQEQLSLAESLRGKLVRFNHEKETDLPHRVAAVANGMIDLDDLGGWFAPHLFKIAGDDPKAAPCEHLNFQAAVNVGRLSGVVGGAITGYCADVKIQCAGCGMPFRFLGLAAGNHYAEPRVSIDGTELRAPIEPATHEKFAPVARYTLPPKAPN